MGRGGHTGTYQSKPLNESVYMSVRLLCCHGSGEAKPCCHLERLTNSKLREEDVILANVCLSAIQQQAGIVNLRPIVPLVARCSPDRTVILALSVDE